MRELLSRIAERLKAGIAPGLYWIEHRGIPSVQRTGRQVVQRLTADRARQHWSVLRPSTSWSRRITWSMVGVAGFGLVWSCFARIDEVVQATGKLEPLGVTKEVKAPLGGVISRILVRDGDSVRQGQVLMELDTEAASAKLKALLAVRTRVQADLALSRAQLGQRVNARDLNANQAGKLTALRDEYSSRIAAAEQTVAQAQASLREVEAQLMARQQALQIRAQIMRDITPLVASGAMARSQYLKEKQEFLTLRGEVAALRQNRIRSREALNEARQKLLNTRALTRIDFATKVEEGEKQLAELTNQISETQLTLKYQQLKAPVTGVVFDLKPTAPGYVINGSVPEPVVKIVPTDHLVARLFITNKDIGFVRPGQKVSVRVDAFPYNEFGEIDGKVKSIGSDVLAPDQTYNYFRFPVTVAMASNTLAYKGRQLRLLSGMSVTANVVLRQRPVIAIFAQQILPFWDSLEKL
jgi:HlyD family secretion protein